MFFRGGKKTIHFNHVCSMTSQQVITHMASHDRLAHNSLKWDIFDNTRTIINTTSGCMCGKEAQRELARGDKIIVLVKQLAIYLSIYLSIYLQQSQAMASASLLKSSPVLDKSEWVKGQTLRQPSVSVVRCHPTPPPPSPSGPVPMPTSLSRPQ
jgi:hypothetical protein